MSDMRTDAEIETLVLLFVFFNPRTHLVLLPQLLHVALLAADLPLPLAVALLRSVQLQTLLRVALRQAG